LSLLLKADDLAAIRRQAEADYPNETCGLLGGRWTDSTGGAHAGDHVKRVERLVPVANARHDSARNRYLIEPDAFRRAAQELERAGLDVIGVYLVVHHRAGECGPGRRGEQLGARRRPHGVSPRIH
jgi:proteasome lid subunit RPN8/RPN11